MLKLIKRLTCDHEYETITNLYGDAINAFSSGKKVIRSIQECSYCGKLRGSEYLDYNCKVTNFKRKQEV